MRRVVGITAVCFAWAAAQVTAAPLPDWMLGDWPVEKTYQDRYKPYEPQGGPAVWWKGRTFHIGKDRLAFADWVCQGPHATLRRAPLAKLVARKTGGTPDDIGLSAGSGPVAYYDISCDRSLVWHGSFQDHPGRFGDLGISLPWLIVVHSPSEIAMPFQASSYVVFARTAPAT